MAENSNGAIRKIRKNGDHEWNTVVEQTHAALQQRLTVSGECKQKSGTRSGVSGTGDRVSVQTDTEVQRKTWVDCPLVAGEPGGFVLICLKRPRRAESEPEACRCRPIFCGLYGPDRQVQPYRGRQGTVGAGCQAWICLLHRSRKYCVRGELRTSPSQGSRPGVHEGMEKIAAPSQKFAGSRCLRDRALVLAICPFFSSSCLLSGNLTWCL